MVGRATQFAALVLVIAIAGMPVMACMVQPGRQMTTEEHDCCKKMAQGCESSAMPTSHSCCSHRVSPQVACVSRVWSGHLGLVVAALVDTSFRAANPPTDGVVVGFESPPESPPQTSTVLRI